MAEKDVLTLEKLFEDRLADFKAMKLCVLVGLLDPHQEYRTAAIQMFNNQYEGIIRKGYTKDNKIYVKLTAGKVLGTYYVCDLPKIYIKGQPVIPHHFDLDAN